MAKRFGLLLLMLLAVGRFWAYALAARALTWVVMTRPFLRRPRLGFWLLRRIDLLKHRSLTAMFRAGQYYGERSRLPPRPPLA